MVPALRSESSALAELEALLRSEPFGFEFFQAVRLLERMQPDRAPVGRFAHPKNEIARFSAHPSLSFPASELQGLEWDGPGPPRMTVNFMGLIGPLGVLPLYYTQLVQERLKSKDTTMRDFLDIFQHRMISLFYAAWEKHRFTVGYERDQKDPFSRYIMDLIGLGTPGLQQRQAVRDESLMFYSGMLRMMPRSESALRHILSDYFGIEVEIEQFVGAWRALSDADECVFEGADGPSNQLGMGAVVGDEIWDQQSRVRIRLGPLTRERYLDFLPGGAAWEPLQTLTKFFSGDDLEFEVQLVLEREEVPSCELGGGASRLGWLTWMHSRPEFDRHPGDTILLLERRA